MWHVVPGYLFGVPRAGRTVIVPAGQYTRVLVRNAAMHVRVASVGFGVVEKVHTWRLVA